MYYIVFAEPNEQGIIEVDPVFVFNTWEALLRWGKTIPIFGEGIKWPDKPPEGDQHRSFVFVNERTGKKLTVGIGVVKPKEYIGSGRRDV